MPKGHPKNKSTRELNDLEKRPLRTAIDETVTKVDEELALLRKMAARHEREQEGPRIPGQIIKGVKVPWTYGDMVKRYEIVTFIPDETIPLTWNGVKVQAHSGLEMHVPKPFYELYNRHRAELRPRAPPLGVTVELGAGALPPE